MRSRFWIFPMSMALVFCLSTFGCPDSDKNKEKDKKKGFSPQKGKTAEPPAGKTKGEGSDENLEEHVHLEDTGMRCRYHEYKMPADRLYTVRFSKTIYSVDKPGTNWKITEEEPQRLGMDFHIDEVSIDPFFAEVWHVDGTDLPSRVLNSIPDDSISNDPLADPPFLVLWKRNGTGVLAIDTFKGGEYGPDFNFVQTARLNETEILNELGEINKVVTWADADSADLSLYRDEVSLYVVNIDIHVKTPEDKDVTTSGDTYEVVIEGYSPNKMVLEVNRSSSRDKWHVLGPAQNRDCFD